MLERILDEAQAGQLPALIADWERAGDERFWIARALRIDLTLLVERPELVVPCLYRRCAFLGDEGAFYRERPPPATDFRALRALVRAWAAELSRPWLRTARPLATPLDGALREEYRGASGEIWASGDGAWLGGIGKWRVAWDRATGRRLAGANIVEEALPPAPRPWTFATESPSTRIVLERDGTRIELAIDDGLRALSAVTLADELVVVHGDEPFESPVFFVVDTHARRVCWRGTGEPQRMVLRGDTLVIVDNSNLLDEYELATGIVRRSARLPGTGITLLGDGALATHGGCISVWDFDAVRSTSVSVRAHGNVAISRDSTRVITGTLLCDARTGAVIADLPFSRPRNQWYDGQPPHNGRALVGDVVAELSPDGLARWQISDGGRLPTLPFTANGLDHCAWDPHGRFVAVWSSHPSYELAIRSLVDGAPIARSSQRPDRHRRPFGFSADGERLVWGTADGDVVGVHLADPTQVVAMDASVVAARPAPVKPQAGLLVVGDAAIPCDSALASSPDGRAFASCGEHYVLEG